MIGGTGFVGIGSSAYHHLAAVAGCQLPCGEIGGWFDHGMPKLINNHLDFDNSTYVSLIDEPGHGAKPDLKSLETYLAGSNEFSCLRTPIS